MRRYGMGFVLLIGAIFFSGLTYPDTIVATYNANGKFVQLVRTTEYSPETAWAWKTDSEMRSDKPWPEWSKEQCSRFSWITDSQYCLRCHRNDRTIKGKK